MKNKISQNNRGGQHKVLNASKPPMNTKNRDQLRKKLKGLLEKQIVSPSQNAGQKLSTEAHTSNVTNRNHSLVNKSKSKGFKPNGNDRKPSDIPNKQKGALSANNPKKNLLPTFNSKTGNPKNVATKSNLSRKSVNVDFNQGNRKRNELLKRFSNKNGEGLKNGSKAPEQPPISDDGLKTKKKKLSGSNQKPISQQVNSANKTVKKEKKKKTIGSAKNDESTKTKSKSDKKGQYTQGRGPLRPQTSESEFDGDLDSSPRQLKRKSSQKISSDSEVDSTLKTKQKAPNMEQALVRAENDFEGSKNDQPYFDFLFDDTYDHSDETTSFSSDSQNEYTEEESEFEYSDEDSDLDYASASFEDESSDNSDEYTEDEYCDEYLSDLMSSDDESYQPPENVPEDVYIAKGTAVKYDISTDDVDFDSDTHSAQIIEMPTKEIDQIRSPNNNPLPLPNNQKELKKRPCDNDEVSVDGSDDSCPSLVYCSSSCYSSHSCNSSCDCGSCPENADSDSEQQYHPMAPEVIKASAVNSAEMETFFDAKTSNPQTKLLSNSILEEITSSSDNPLKFKVYTINNEVLNNDSFSSESSKGSIECSPKRVDSNIEKSDFVELQGINEMPELMTEATHVNKKLKVTPVSSLENEIPSRKSFESTAESNPFNRKEETSFTKQLKPKPTMRTLFFNAVNCNHVIVLLKDPLYIYGTVKLKLLAGCLQIFGYHPKRNEELEIFSPRGYSSLKIESSNHGVNVPLNEKEILSLTPYFIRSDLEQVVKEFEPGKDAILILERNDRSKKINMLRKYMVEPLFPNMNSIQSNRPFYTSEFLLRCIITPSSDNGILINPDWNAIQVQNDSKIMLIGGKSVGKSTLMRYIVNKSLNNHQKILLVDLDIGQPEMFVPQTISATTLTAPLLGPGYFLNKQPDKSFLVGNFNIIHSLEPYIKSLKALIEYCNGNSDYKNIPWVINTMGYNKGFGDELISVICGLLQPSNIVQFESDREVNDFDFFMNKENVKSIERNIVGDIFKPSNELVPLHNLTLIRAFMPNKRNPRNESIVKPRDMRLAMILTRLSSILIGHAEWLTDVKPVCASIDDLHIIKMGDDQVEKEELVKALVGNLVYLSRIEPGKAHECFGIGIVRGVDYPLRQIYLLPTIALDVLKNVNCLAICGIPLPSSILLKQGPKVRGTASYVYNTLDEAASMYIQQMFNKPQQFPAVKRKRVLK